MNQQKLARICFNTNSWTKPSGVNGKSTNKKTYEREFGFGHEEWLLDFTKLINGYHYSFLQPINSAIKKFSNCEDVYDIHLYTHHADGTDYYVGVLRNVEFVSSEESDVVMEQYHKLGWLDEMKDDVVAVKANSKGLLKGKSMISQWFNIKFKPVNFEADARLLPLVSHSIDSYRYILLNINGSLFGKKSIFKKEESLVSRILEPRTIICNRIHNKMQNAILNELNKKGWTQVRLESNFVDISGVSPSGDLCLFEVKSFGGMQCIREALGQILEYSYFQNTPKAKQLYIVGLYALSVEDSKYLNWLKTSYGLPINYLYFDMDKRILNGNF